MYVHECAALVQRGRSGAAALTAVLASAALSPGVAGAAQLEERLQQQEQRVRVLERRLDQNEEATKEAADSAPVIKAGPKGFSIASADNANQLRIRGLLHFDGRYHFDDVAPDSADTWLLRRVRPAIEGSLNEYFDFRLMPDFSGGKAIILDAYGALRLRPWAVITAGKLKVPVGLERLIAASDLKFIERGFPTSLVPNRDLGVQLSGDAAGGALQYSVGSFNGVVDGGSSDAQGDVDTDGAQDFAARLFLQPFLASDRSALRGLGFGLAGTYADVGGTPQNPLLPAYRNPDQEVFFRYRGDDPATPGINEASYLHGARLRLAPQAYYYFGPFGALGEYTQVRQHISRNTVDGVRSGDIENTAWQIELSYFLTGEAAQYKGFTPLGTFRPYSQGWGAFELVARYQELRIDDRAFAGASASFADSATQPRKASAYTLGLNWYFNQNCKWQINYEQVAYEGGAAGGEDRADSEAVLTRLAVAF